MSTVKILLYAGNFCTSSPLDLGEIPSFGTIYLSSESGQSAGNFSFSTMATAATKNTYNKYTSLPKISEHVGEHKSNLNDHEFGSFLAGLIEGDGWFGKKQLYIIFSENDTSLAYYIKKRIGSLAHGRIWIGNSLNLSSLPYLSKLKIPGSFRETFRFPDRKPSGFRQMSNMVAKKCKSTKLNPFWVTGFSDGDSSFQLAIIRNSKFKVGYQIRFTFSIWLNQKDKILLEKLKDFFGVGEVYKAGSEGFDYDYRVSSLKELEVITRHFDSYPLITQKWSDYQLFRQALEKVQRKEHLTPEGLIELVEIKASMNLGLNSTLNSIFGKSIVPVSRPMLQDPYIPNEYWVGGFTSAEGLFFVVKNKSPLSKLGVSVRLTFEISQHLRDELLFKKLVNYLGCGRIIYESNQQLVKFIVSKHSDIVEKIIPFFNQYSILGDKAKDYKDFCKVAKLISSKTHLTQEGLDKILSIKAGMNYGRLRSTFTSSNLLPKARMDSEATTSINRYNFSKRKFSTLRHISEHVGKHKSNLTDVEFGYFLTGLIEGKGNFAKNELYVDLSPKDTSLVYWIKKRIGFGTVVKIKDKKAVRYICKHGKGLSVILSLINGKLVSNFKYDQLIKHNYGGDFGIEIIPPCNKLSLDNYWLAGFTQADGCFHICIVKSKTHKTGYNVRLEYSLKQNDDLPLKLLYDLLKKGNLSHYATGIWCYKSTGYMTAAVLIDYFDKFHVFAGKYVDYLKFRKVYIRITEGKHLCTEGVKKIRSIATKGSSETSTQEI